MSSQPIHLQSWNRFVLRAFAVAPSLLGATHTWQMDDAVIELRLPSAEKIEKDRDDDLPMLPELAKLAGTRVLCVYGTEEKRSLCPLLPAGTARVVAKVGGHHLDKDYAALAQLIVEESRAP